MCSSAFSSEESILEINFPIPNKHSIVIAPGLFVLFVINFYTWILLCVLPCKSYKIMSVIIEALTLHPVKVNTQVKLLKAVIDSNILYYL